MSEKHPIFNPWSLLIIGIGMLLIFTFLTQVGNPQEEPQYMSDEWVVEKAKEQGVYSDRFWVGEYILMGRRCGVRGVEGVVGGWWSGYIDWSGNIHVEVQS